MAPPAFDHDPGLRERIENLPIQQLVPEPSVEALDEAVLPGAARRDISRLRSDSRDPVLHGLGDELRSVVRAKALGNAAQDEQPAAGSSTRQSMPAALKVFGAAVRPSTRQSKPAASKEVRSAVRHT